MVRHEHAEVDLTGAASFAQGIATGQPVSTVAAEGRVSGVELTMGVAGAPFWAVRQDIVRPDNCIPVP